MRKRANHPLAESSKGERGISPVIGAILVISIVSLSMSVYLQQVVPVHQRRNEAAHMHKIRAAFSELQGMILNGESGEIEVPMAPEPTPIFALSPQPNRIEVKPALWVKRFQPVEDAHVDELTGQGFNDEFLTVMSSPVTNRRVFLKFDVLGELGPGVRIVEAWLVLYCENISKYMAAPWEMDQFRPGENTTPIDPFYLPNLPLIIEVYEVEDTAWTEETINWPGPALGDPILALEWPHEDNQTIKFGEVWYTWDVTSWVKERVEAGEQVSLALKAAYEDSTLERYANFTSKEGWGRGVVNIFGVSDLNNNGVIDENEVEEEDRRDKVTGHPPYPKPHLTVIYENGLNIPPPLLDNWGAFVEGGYVRFDAQYYEFPEHSFVLESGGLFQQQYGYAYEFMISDPGLLVGEHLEGKDAIVVVLNRYRIVSWDHITTSSDIVLRVKVKENSDDYVPGVHYPIDEDGDGDLDPNRENITITIRSEFEWPWKRYLRDLTGNWNQSVSKGGLQWMVDYYGNRDGEPEYGDPWSNNIADPMVVKQVVGRNLRLYVWGRVEDPSIDDIFYYDRTYDVEVIIGVL
jgi:hypothetical protein